MYKILSQSVKKYVTMRKIILPVTLTAVPEDEQRSIIWFLILETVSDCEIHARLCTIYGAQNVIAKSTGDLWVQRFKMG